MPIICNVPLPDLTAHHQEPIVDSDHGVPTGDPRFSGYPVNLDENGNIVQPTLPMTQPAFWATRATSIGYLDARSP
jgi:hypothetical protein